MGGKFHCLDGLKIHVSHAEFRSGGGGVKRECSTSPGGIKRGIRFGVSGFLPVLRSDRTCSSAYPVSLKVQIGAVKYRGCNYILSGGRLPV